MFEYDEYLDHATALRCVNGGSINSAENLLLSPSAPALPLFARSSAKSRRNIIIEAFGFIGRKISRAIIYLYISLFFSSDLPKYFCANSRTRYLRHTREFPLTMRLSAFFFLRLHSDLLHLLLRRVGGSLQYLHERHARYVELPETEVDSKR